MLRLEENDSGLGQTIMTAELRGIIALLADMKWLHRVNDPSLENDAYGLLHHVMAKLKTAQLRSPQQSKAWS